MLKYKIGMLFFLGAAVLFLLTPGTQAQTVTNQLEQATVQIWPDYDRPSVLVLITGQLPAGTALPATVSVPLPGDATINAIARLTVDNQMFDDIDFQVGDGAVSLTTPEQRFRVEYYMPYDVNGDVHQFTFTWDGETAVSLLNLTIQQPRSAASIATTPQAETIIAGSDGLNYYDFADQPVIPGQPLRVDVEYVMPTAELTAAPANPIIADLEASGAASSSGNTAVAADTGGLDWPLIITVAGLLLILGAGAWQFLGRRTHRSAAPRKPKPRRAQPRRRPTPPPAPPASGTKPAGKVNFCHECGAKLTPANRFCRECGSPVRGN